MKSLKCYYFITILLACSGYTVAKNTVSQCMTLDSVEAATHCLEQSYKVADQNLNKQYKQLMGSLSPQEQSKLREKQRVWLTSRNTQCDKINNTATRKVCYIKSSQEKTTELQQLFSKSPVSTSKHFEGIYKSCFRIGKSNPDALRRYGSEPICTENFLLQEGKNICGTWEYWASGASYSGNIHYRLVDNETARSKKICGTPGSDTETECEVMNAKGQSLQASYQDWEDNQKQTLKYCNQQVTQGVDLPCAKIKKYQNTANEYQTKQVITVAKKQALLKEHPWLQQCLDSKI